VKKPPLHVFTGSLPAGSLTHSDREADKILFSYRQSAHPEDAVSVTMPVRADQYDRSRYPTMLLNEARLIS
jgi:hypothetical protein